MAASHRTRAARSVSTLTTTEAAVLALLAIEGERSGYDLLRFVGQAIGYVWAPARSQLYAVLPRLVSRGLAESRAVVQDGRPDKSLYRITDGGREALAAWHETVEPGAADSFYLKLFVGSLTSRENLIAQVEQYRADVEERLDELRRIEPTNTRTGHDYFHWFLLRLGIERNELQLRWAEETLRTLREDAE
jgi:PadR family transcriptional regulator, regulatory protein AphA